MSLMMGAIAGLGKGMSDVAEQNNKNWAAQELAQLNSELDTQKALRIAEHGRALQEQTKDADFARIQNETPVRAKLAATAETIRGTEKLNFEESTADRRRALAIGDKDSELEWQSDNAATINKLARAKALATHIVDPSYEKIVSDNGTVQMIDRHNPNAPAITVKDINGAPISFKSESERARAQEAVAILNQAKVPYEAAAAAYKANSMDPVAKDEFIKAEKQYRAATAGAVKFLSDRLGIEQQTPTGQQYNDATGDVMINGKIVGNIGAGLTKAQALSKLSTKVQNAPTPVARPQRGMQDATADDITNTENARLARVSALEEDRRAKRLRNQEEATSGMGLINSMYRR